jgi:hypothetical protein
VGVESFGILVPGEPALIAFGVLAGQGRYSITIVIAVAAAAAILGDNLGYWLIGLRGGRALIARAGQRPRWTLVAAAWSRNRQPPSAETKETTPEQPETRSPLTDSNRRPPRYHRGHSRTRLSC